MSEATVISVSNYKGGVGKTTSVHALACEAARRGLRTLAIDCEPQNSLTMICGMAASDLEVEETSVALLLPDLWSPPVEPTDLPRTVEHLGFDIIPAPADRKLNDALPNIENRRGSLRCLERALPELRHRYELILIDTPPDSNLLTDNAWMASDWLLVPVETAIQAVDGLINMLNDFDDFTENERAGCQLLGFFATRFDARVNDHHRCLKEIATVEPTDKRLHAVIPARASIPTSQGEARPIWESERRGVHTKASDAYALLFDEIAQRTGRPWAAMADAAKAA